MFLIPLRKYRILLSHIFHRKRDSELTLCICISLSLRKMTNCIESCSKKRESLTDILIEPPGVILISDIVEKTKHKAVAKRSVSHGSKFLNQYIANILFYTQETNIKDEKL